jgi:uncharacterized membrane protein
MIARSVVGKILVFAVFFIGIATGAVLDNVYRTRVAPSSDVSANRGDRPSPQERARRDLDDMFRYLGVEPAQQDQIRAILGETRTEFRQLREEVDPKFRAIEEDSREKIRAVLNDEQRRKWDEFQKSHPRGDRGRPPRPPDSKNKGKDK